MSKSRDILLKLIRMAMGWTEDYHLPNDIVWGEVFYLAEEQGVVPIVLDGYEKYIKVPKDIQIQVSPKDKELFLEAIGILQLSENNYHRQVDALKELGRILGDKGVPFILMKGLSCGQYYPNPKHRECGDIDIYPGKYFESSNDILKAAGIEVDPHYYRHTVSFVKDVMVENHRVLADLRGPSKQMREMEKHLEGEAEWSFYVGKTIVLGGEELNAGKFPTADFNALFLPWHVSAHFMFERVTIRHLLDWALFLVHEGDKINVEKFLAAKKRFTYGYSKMTDILTNLSLRYLGIPKGVIPPEIIRDAESFDDQLADKVFEYMFIGQPRERDENVWKFRWNNVKRIWQERWKYKEVYDTSALMFAMRKVWGVLRSVGE